MSRRLSIALLTTILRHSKSAILPSSPKPRHKAGRIYDHGVVAGKHFVYQLCRSTTLCSVLVDRHKAVAQRVDSHKKVVYNKMYRTVIVAVQPCNHRHSVETAQRVVRCDYTSRRCGKTSGILYFEFYTESIEDTFAELRSTPREVAHKQVVELILPDKPFYSLHKYAWHVPRTASKLLRSSRPISICMSLSVGISNKVQN